MKFLQLSRFGRAIHWDRHRRKGLALARHERQAKFCPGRTLNRFFFLL
jgi:hypothetical protein